MRIAVAGAGPEGLEVLSLLAQQKDVQVLALVDPDERALGFHLKDYGYRFANTLRLRLSHRFRDLPGFQKLDLIVDASPDHQYRKELFELDCHPAEIMSGETARFLWEWIQEPDIRRRRASALERFPKVLAGLEVDLAGEEPYRLLIRLLRRATHASGIQMLGFEEDIVVRDLYSPGGFRIQRSGLDVLTPDPASWLEMIQEGATRKITATSDGKRAIIKGKIGAVAWGMATGTEKRGPRGLFIFSYEDHRLGRMEEDLQFADDLLQRGSEFLERFRKGRDDRNVGLAKVLPGEIASLLITSAPPMEMLKISVQKLAARLKARGCHLYIQDPQTEDLTLVGTTYRLPETLGQLRIPRNHGILGESVRRGRPIFLRESFPWFDGEDRLFPPSRDLCGVCCLPLKVGGDSPKEPERPVGVMLLEFSTLQWMNREVFQSLLKVGDTIAGVISNDAERYRMSQKVTRLSVVNEEGVELLSSMDRQKVFTLTASSAAMIVDAEVAILRSFRDAGDLAVGATYGLREDEGDTALLEIDRTLAQRLAEQKEALFFPDIREEGGSDLPERFPYRAGLVIPVRFEENLLGTLSVYNKLQFSTFSSTVFTEDDQEILERFNLYVARAMLNIQQFNQQQAGVTIDPVTGLRNEQYLRTRLPEEVRRAERYHRQVSLIFLDVYAEADGNRKDLNEETVRKIAGAVRETFRFIDVLVHLKDSKFAALLPDTGEGVRLAVARISNRLAQEAKAMGQPLKLLAGYGTYPVDGPDVIDLIKKASKLSLYPE